MRITRLKTPLSKKDVESLRAGDVVAIDGIIVTARDKAYARIVAEGKPPIDLQGSAIYHCGPLVKQAARGWRVVSAGPTTSARMDPVQVDFIKLTGIRAIIGKGGIRREVACGLAKLGCVYLAFTGGAGALAASQVEKVEDVFWKELGPEAMWVLRVKGFGPLVVAIDVVGDNLYER